MRKTQKKKGAWSYQEDVFLVQHFDAMGAFIGAHDLGRSEASTVQRVKKLKECGFWEHMRLALYQEATAKLCRAKVTRMSNLEIDMMMDAQDQFKPDQSLSPLVSS